MPKISEIQKRPHHERQTASELTRSRSRRPRVHPSRNRHKIDEAISMGLTGEHFYDLRHAYLWKVILDLHREGKPVDMVLLITPAGGPGAHRVRRRHGAPDVPGGERASSRC